MAEGVAEVLADAGMPVTTNRVGAMWTWFFTNERVVDFATAATSDTARFGVLSSRHDGCRRMAAAFAV